MDNLSETLIGSISVFSIFLIGVGSGGIIGEGLPVQAWFVFLITGIAYIFLLYNEVIRLRTLEENIDELFDKKREVRK